MAFQSENTAVFQNVQYGKEAAIGAGGTCDKFLSTISIAPSPKIALSPFTKNGSIAVTAVAVGKDMSTFKVTADAICYEECDFILGSVMAKGAGGVYEIKSDEPNEPQTYAIQFGQDGNCRTFPGGIITGSTWTFSRDAVKVSADGMGGKMEAGTWNTGATSLSGFSTINPADCTLKLDDTTFGRGFNCEISITDRWVDVWILDGNDNFVNYCEKMPKLEVKTMLEVDDEYDAIVTDLRDDNPNKNIKLVATNGIKSLTFDMNCIVSGLEDFKDEQGTYATSVTWSMSPNSTYLCKATLV